MFKFIKELFSEKPEKSPEEPLQMTREVALRYIEEQEKSEQQQLNEKLRLFHREIVGLVDQVQKRTNELEQLNLRNPNISEKEKHFMQGNREAFLRAVKILISHLQVHALTIDNAENYLKVSKAQYPHFAETSARPYLILKEFFANEAKQIALDIKSMEDKLHQIEAVITQSKLPQLRMIKEKLHNLADKKKHLVGLHEGKESEKNLTKIFEKEKEQAESALKKLINSSAYAHWQSLFEKKRQKEQEWKQKEMDFLHDFSILEDALQKYEHMTFEYKAIIAVLLNNPLQCFVENLDQCLKVLEKLKETIQKGKIDLKEKKKEKSLLVIDTLTRENMENLVREYQEHAAKVKEMDKAINQLTITRDLEELQKRKKDLEEKLMLRSRGETEKKIVDEQKMIQDLKVQIEQGFQTYAHRVLKLVE